MDDRRLDVYARLTEHQLRNRLEPGEATVIAESRLVVEVALECGARPRSFLVDERDLASSADVLARAGDDVDAYVLPHEEVSRLTGFRMTRGLMCALHRPSERTVGEVVSGARRVAVLEDLVDVANVGALFRSAAALGADAVVLSPRCADPLCRRALRVSMGCVLKLPWARATAGEWPEATLDGLRAQGFTVLALALTEGAVPLDDPSLRAGERRALVFGTEGTGLARRTLDACDRSVIIPMGRGVDSLNVAASSAVAFWQLFR
nr:RNA methyltransferase [Olsenella profusa]